MISVGMDSKMVMANLPILSTKIGVASAFTVQDVAYEVLRLTQFEVPHDEGTLQNSGTVEPVGGDFVLGYHTPYAARLHEHPEYHFQKGRKGKYISDPIQRNAAVLGLRVKTSFGERLTN